MLSIFVMYLGFLYKKLNEQIYKNKIHENIKGKVF